MSLEIKDKRPVIVTNGPSSITTAQGVATALGISADDVTVINTVNGKTHAIAYLPYMWTVTSAFDTDSSLLLRSNETIGPLTGQKIPSSLILQINFYGTIQ